VTSISLGTGRTTVLQGTVLLVIFATYLFTTIVSMFAAVLLVEASRRKRMILYAVFLALMPLLTVLANLILIDRGSGVVAHRILEDGNLEAFQLKADPKTLIEDNLYYFANTANVVPERVPHRSPFELYFYTFINPIPRYLWPNKPYMSQEYLGRIRPYYASVTLVGDFYLYGGWLHIIIGGLVFGAMLKRVDLFGKAVAAPATGRTALFVMLVMLLYSSLRALWNFIWGLYAIVVLMALLHWLRREQERKRAQRAGAAVR
jgi:hypothetical protein